MDFLFLSNAEDKENSLMHQSYLLDEEQKVSLTNFSHCTNSTDALPLMGANSEGSAKFSFKCKFLLFELLNLVLCRLNFSIQFSQVSEVLEAAGLELTNFVRVEVGRS